MAATKEVLVVYRDRRRPIVEDPKEERVRLLDAVKVAFSDVLETGESAGTPYMQTKSRINWHRRPLINYARK